jgi:S-adenosylmethionine/arginine decarboxylase-like enzyme
MKYWGYHFLLDCSDCDTALISNRDNIVNFVKILTQRIDMIAIGEPIVELLLEGEDNEGYSLMQLISTSNITGHFVTNYQSAYIDVFSCKKFDTHIVEDTVNEFFKPKNNRLTFLTRHA